MSFDVNSAMSGASAGMALGPWGAAAGGLIGGFLGGGEAEPEMYTAAQYHQDMAPYKAMIDEQAAMGTSLMNRNSAMNRRMNQQTIANSMDQMGTANMMAQRNAAQSGGGIGNSGLLQAAIQQNMSQYGQQGLQAADAQFQNMFQQGIAAKNTALQHQGDYSSGLAELGAGNVRAQNEANFYNQSQRSGALGGLLGTGSEAIAGMEVVRGKGKDAQTLKGLDALMSYF